MHESEPDNKWLDEETTGDGDEIPFTDQPPRDVEMATLGMLMRIYDVQLALLNHFNTVEADTIFEAHAEGRYFTPAVFIPDFKRMDKDIPPAETH